MPRYEMAEKFWDIRLEGTKFFTNFGKLGTTGQTRLKEYKTDAEAKVGHDKAIADKLKEGFALVGGAKPKVGKQAAKAAAATAEARNPELEKAILADPYDEDAYSVLGDWLQAQGDPRGELIALQLAGKHKEAKKLVTKQAATFLGPLADHQKTHDGEGTDAFTWKFGFIHAARLSHDSYGDEGFDGSLAEVFEALLRHPSGRFLAEITFQFNGDPNESDLQDLIDLLAKHAPPTIRKLHFGDYDFCGERFVKSKTKTGNTEISWYSIGNLAKLWKKVPGLRTLITMGGSDDSAIAGGMQLGKLDLPALVHAEFRTGGLEVANAKAIASGKFPEIEHLEIWYGDDSYGGDCTIKQVAPLIARTDLPKLRHLGLRNAMFADDMIAPLATSKLVKQLAVLDLSLGCLTDAGAANLVANKAAFAHLDKLDVSASYLSKKAIASLKGVAKTVIAKDQRIDDLDPDEPDFRMTAVAE